MGLALMLEVTGCGQREQNKMKNINACLHCGNQAFWNIVNYGRGSVRKVLRGYQLVCKHCSCRTGMYSNETWSNPKQRAIKAWNAVKSKNTKNNE